MRLVLARCEVNYSGRGQTELPVAVRLLMLKRDGSVSVHSDDRAFKPLNWMLPPLLLTETIDSAGLTVWTFASKKETLTIVIHELISETSYELEESEPGLVRSWTENHIQGWIALHLEELFDEPGWLLHSREYQTGAGPVDILAISPRGEAVAIEVKRTAQMGAVDQASRYVEAMVEKNDWSKVLGMVVALDVRPRARELANSRGIKWLELPERIFRRS